MIFSSKWISKTWLLQLLALAFTPLAIARTQPENVTVTVAADNGGPALAGHFLGLSYESSMLLPVNGKYYFDANDKALLNTFQTLGIKSLRVGANAVDDPRIAVPDQDDVDSLFDF